MRKISMTTSYFMKFGDEPDGFARMRKMGFDACDYAALTNPDGEIFRLSEDARLRVLETVRENAKKAGVAARIRVRQQPVKAFSVEEERALIICNPPCGERMLEVAQEREIYREMGKTFPQRDGVRSYIISPDEEFEQCFGRKADKLRKLYNGMLKCNLYMYFK